MASFAWSGKNSHRARDQATSELVAHLESSIQEDPKAWRWIIAHSHGGNIALRAKMAVEQSNTRTIPLSVVTLATPFIHSRGRVVSFYQSMMTALFGVLLIAGGWAGVLSEPRTVIDWILFSFASLFAMMVTLCVVGLVMHREKLGTGFRDKLVHSVNCPSVDVHQIAVVRSAGDEASTLLVAGQFVGWFTGVTGRILGSLGLWSFIILTTQASFLLAVALDTRKLAFMQYVFAAPGLTLVALITLLLSSSLVFGVDGPFVSLFAFSSVEASPPGKALMMQLEPFASRGGRLAHSRLYEEERVIREIVDMIRGSAVTEGHPASNSRKRQQGSRVSLSGLPDHDSSTPG
ncbi:hypothetical protein G3M58_63795 [Streptomyces sp. SID7499]|uniref:Uncharacterized protein n=1 Tax=Streptomyces sp. SID7499 TaxID=2706086 RepID=A0A6G3XHY6_9ACTN|nr:hypothetical protein [Streptomyces sp. SID7499]